MSAALPTEDTKAAEEVPLMSEVAKARVADDDSQSTLSRLAKMDKIIFIRNFPSLIRS